MGLTAARDSGCIATVLTVTSDAEWAAKVTAALRGEHFATVVTQPRDALTGALSVKPDLLLVDVSHPHDVCRALRVRYDSPMIVLVRSDTNDAVVSAFSAGADVVVSHRASPREIVARTRTLLRRTLPRQRSRRSVAEPFVCLDDITRSATVGGRSVALPGPEFELLAALVARSGDVIRKKDLLRALPVGRAGSPDLDDAVRRLRSRLELVCGQRIVIAIRGVGYRIATPDGTGAAPVASGALEP